ncbi:hypothetical protein GALL_174280 [mine drainage metagenome]|uniref:Uncharacterized protein n=1 Tax=mine drainage metagenome TaxID=410659 RepID=A0A1J5RY04_9ZZZZ
MAEAGSFVSRCKGGAAAGGKDLGVAIAGPGRLRPDRPLEGRGTALSDILEKRWTEQGGMPLSCISAMASWDHETGDVFRRNLHP